MELSAEQKISQAMMKANAYPKVSCFTAHITLWSESVKKGYSRLPLVTTDSLRDWCHNEIFQAELMVVRGYILWRRTRWKSWQKKAEFWGSFFMLTVVVGKPGKEKSLFGTLGTLLPLDHCQWPQRDGRGNLTYISQIILHSILGFAMTFHWWSILMDSSVETT